MDSATRVSAQFWIYMHSNLNSHQLARDLWAKIILGKLLVNKTRNKIDKNQPQKLWYYSGIAILTAAGPLTPWFNLKIPLAICGHSCYVLSIFKIFSVKSLNICVDMYHIYSVVKSHVVYKVVWQAGLDLGKVKKTFCPLVDAKTFHLLNK